MLQSHLGRQGTILDFWMDPIKTHCYVTYAKPSVAALVKAELHDSTWPPETGKKLTVKYVTKEEAKAAIKKEESNHAPSAHRIGFEGLHDTPVQRPSDPHIIRTTPSPPGKSDLPAKALDDLFKKTITEPAIYFLPLSDAQVKDKHASDTTDPVRRL